MKSIGDGTWPANSWQWLDGNGDGVAECYYFDGNGYMLANTTTPDGYTVNADGAWTVNGKIQTRTDVGVVQTKNVGTVNTGVNHGANYDPAHPLAGKIDEWNLRLRKTTATAMGTMTVIGTWNVHAMLTGQMDMYEEPTGYGADEQKATEQELYAWFCNWLNGMDFENMSEMDRAREIQKVMAQVRFRTSGERNGSTKWTYYDVLINKEGACAECAMTACALAKALGLKAAISGTGNHMVYYIQVDGKAYFGQNETLNLNSPTPDYVPFSN